MKKVKLFKPLERMVRERTEKSFHSSIERMKEAKPDSWVFVFTEGNRITFLSDPGVSHSSAIGMLERAKFDLLMKMDAN